MIRVRFDERREQLLRDIDIAFSKLAVDGLLSSSVAVRTVHELCANDLRLRASIVWESLSRVLSTTDIKPSDELALDLKREVENYLTSVVDELNQIQEKNVKHVGTSHLPSLRGDWDRAIVQIGTEVDLFVESLINRTKSKEEQSESAKTVVNIKGNVGELRVVEKFLRRFSIIRLNEAISEKGVDLLTRYRLSHGLLIADALIAATALTVRAPFLTKNQRDYQFIKDLQSVFEKSLNIE